MLIPQMNIPLEMRLVYFCRHILQRQDIFCQVEKRARRRAETLYKHHPTLLPVEIQRIIGVDDFDSERFTNEGGLEMPFVIKGLLNSHVLEWEDLRESYGDSIVPVHPAAKLGGDWQYHSTRQMSLHDAMCAIERGAPLSVVSTSQVFVDHPELSALLKSDVLASRFGVDFVRHEMFVAGTGTGSAYHCAVGGNFFHMVCGRKKWLLVSPPDSFAMYPTIGRNMGSAIFCSPINSESYERDQKDLYPLYDKVAKYCITLEPGDILYIPSLWWHEVKNIDLTVGVPLRLWGGGKNDLFLLLTILSSYGLKYLPRALAGRITHKQKWLMTDSITRESFGGQRPSKFSDPVQSNTLGTGTANNDMRLRNSERA